MPEIFEAQTEQQIDHVRSLLREYERELPVEYSFVQFHREAQDLPGEYASPRGVLLLATIGGQPAGCGALRPMPMERTCEMKRLYVLPAFRGANLGRLLAERLIVEARARGYRWLRLDTYPTSMQAAVRLYERLGFIRLTDVPNPLPGLLYMQLKL
jgi:ribosomal protein S18 acetylase RimI-like enzyme